MIKGTEGTFIHERDGAILSGAVVISGDDVDLLWDKLTGEIIEKMGVVGERLNLALNYAMRPPSSDSEEF